MRQLNRYLIASAIAFHFTMWGLGMLRITLPGAWPARTQYLYGRLTGAGGSFGFFSPNVPREMQVQFDVMDGDRIITHTTLQEMTVPEVRARLGNMIHLLSKHFHNERIHRAIAASLAASVYQRYPEATAVHLTSYLYAFPNLQAYHEGQRPELIKLYSATFAHADHQAVAKGGPQ